MIRYNIIRLNLNSNSHPPNSMPTIVVWGAEVSVQNKIENIVMRFGGKR